MKKTILKTSILIAGLILLFNSCASNKKEAVQPDSLTEDEEISSISAPQKDTNQNSDKSRYNIKGEKRTTLEKIFTYGNKNDFVTGDITSIFTHGVGLGVYQQKATIMINPEKGTAGFGSIYLASYYILQYNPENYEKLSAAYEKYLEDFENKKLDRKGKNTYKQYGYMNVHLDWGTIKSSTPNNGEGRAYIGYEFVKKSPYFTITIYPVSNAYYEVAEGSVSRESMQLKYAFTKSQMKDILNYTSEEAVTEFMIKYAEENILPEENGDGYNSEGSDDSEEDYTEVSVKEY
ncbi:MAG: hypothetical protein K6C97_01550 [Treponema sp.]|nr:hypothetical protein [Treponema sp.]